MAWFHGLATANRSFADHPVTVFALEAGFGLLIGLLLGMVGGGGSILTVPILVYVIGLSAHDATATSLVVVGATALLGVVPHWRNGNVHVRTALGFGAAGILGAFAGTALHQLVDESLILFGFGFLMLVVAGRMAFSGTPAPRSVSDRQVLLSTIVAGALVGVLTGFFGVGGGFLIVPALVLALGLPMKQAIGTSLLIIAINSAAGAAARWSAGGFDWEVAAIFIAGGVVGSQIGVRVAQRVNDRRLATAFAGLVAVVGMYVIVRNATRVW